MTYALPPLPCALDALAPVIGTEAVSLHHGRHHQGHVDALDAALAPYPEWQGLTIEDLMRRLDEVPAAVRTQVRNQGGGCANHQLFWKVMHPGRTLPGGDLLAQVGRDFGSLDAMKQAFEAAGLARFGSGWVFLLSGPKAGRLVIEGTADQDSALLLGKPALLGNDLWEHAFYLDHRNRRADYLRAWWDVVHWDYVAERLADIRAGKAQL